jgi:hypothetical protein
MRPVVVTMCCTPLTDPPSLGSWGRAGGRIVWPSCVRAAHSRWGSPTVALEAAMRGGTPWQHGTEPDGVGGPCDGAISCEPQFLWRFGGLALFCCTWRPTTTSMPAPRARAKSGAKSGDIKGTTVGLCLLAIAFVFIIFQWNGGTQRGKGVYVRGTQISRAARACRTYLAWVICAHGSESHANGHGSACTQCFLPPSMPNARMHTHTHKHTLIHTHTHTHTNTRTHAGPSHTALHPDARLAKDVRLDEHALTSDKNAAKKAVAAGVPQLGCHAEQHNEVRARCVGVGFDTPACQGHSGTLTQRALTHPCRTCTACSPPVRYTCSTTAVQTHTTRHTHAIHARVPPSAYGDVRG